ncbi:GTPase Era [Synechococcales cyanobacterium C]|uniref:GTPase Era n=1 Tax=Petrachloros mirabilis ULC683 TaxID=2781853 RepID=A0A8K2A9V3_9CYAN|nr:GTPase Era [Petrachloros mirabilis]NCJ08450.1 GTPase Era [Petrachloros mirabilis ULC683]
MDVSDRLPSLIPASPPHFKSGFVGLIGRPNVGKSTLMNQLVGQKIAITSPVAQTTRNRLRGIVTTDTAQLIFVDTPGIHKPHHQLGNILVQNACTSIAVVDVIVLIVDGSVPVGKGDRYIANLLNTSSMPVLLGVNKIDLCTPEASPDLMASYNIFAQEQGWPIFSFSALTQIGLSQLQVAIETRLPEGPYYYPPDLVTDQPERFIMGELIREQILHLTREEVPHSVALSIEKVEETPKITRVLATIHVERESQKSILIGKQGSMLKTIGIEARQQIQKLINGKVYLELFVKVQPKWRQSQNRLADLGYRIES